jgi:hypothetical protein
MDVRGEMKHGNIKGKADEISSTSSGISYENKNILNKEKYEEKRVVSKPENEGNKPENAEIKEEINKDIEEEERGVDDVENKAETGLEKNVKSTEKDNMKDDDKQSKGSKKNLTKEPKESKDDDIDLSQAEDETEKTINHIHQRLSQNEEVEQTPKRDFTGLLLMFALIFSFGAMAFSIVNVFAPSGLSRAYYEKGVKFLNEKNTDRLQALKQELIDTNKAFNKNVTESLDEVRTALVQVNENVKKLNQNMAQVQANISSEISNQATPDLSNLSQSIAELNASIQEIKQQMRLINTNNTFKATPSTDDRQATLDADIEYIGVSPNGAILKITGKGNKGKKGKKEANYITVKAGQVTAYGEVSFVDDQSIVINGKRIEKDKSN